MIVKLNKGSNLPVFYPYPPTRFSAMGMLKCRCSHVARLSPVHVAAYRWLPMKPARVSTKGRRDGWASDRPSKVDRAMSMP